MPPPKYLSPRHLGHRRAFTLIELLAAVAIIAILALVLSSVTKRFIAGAQIAGCLANSRSLAIALLNYAGDNNGNFPEGADAPNSYVRLAGLDQGGYVEDRRIFSCPSDISNYATWTSLSGEPVHSSYKAERTSPIMVDGFTFWVTVDRVATEYPTQFASYLMPAKRVWLLWDDNGYTHGGRYPVIPASGFTATFVDGHSEFFKRP